MKTHKSNPEAYRKLISEVNYQPEENLYIDDNEANTSAAKQTGLKAVLFKNNHQLFQAIKDILAQ